MTAVAPVAPRSIRGIVVVLFCVYLAVVVWMVLFRLQEPFIGMGDVRAVKLVPFVRTADAGSSAPAEVIANVALFVPFGLYLRMLRPRRPWWITAGIAAAASIGLELAQFVLALGVTDVSDVIANTAGGLTGIAIAAAVGRIRGSAVLLSALCAVATALALLALGGVVAARAVPAPALTAAVAASAPPAPPSEAAHPAPSIDSCAC